MSTRANRFRVTVVAPGPGDGPNWYLKIRPPRGRPRRSSSGTTDRADAERQARELEQRLNRHLAPSAGEDPLVITVFDRHVAFRETDKKLTRERTLLSYQSARGSLAKAFDGVHASELTLGATNKGQRALIDAIDHETSTARLYMQKLAHAWKWAHSLAHSGVGPWPGVEPMPVDRTEKRQYTPEEMERVLVEAQGYAGGRFVPLFCLLSECGARIGEVRALRGRDVDRAAGAVTLTTTKTRRRARTRTVAISPEVMSMLPERRPDEWVFRSVRNAEKPLPGRTVTSAIWVILERAGLAGEPLDLHSFRRYVVRKLHSAGVPLKDAMDYVGHETVATHMGYMTDLPSPEAQRSLLERARAHHDPLSVLPGRVPDRVGPTYRRNSRPLQASPLRRRSTPDGHDDGAPSPRAKAGRTGSTPEVVADRRSRKVVALTRTPEARALGDLLTSAPQAWRDAVFALAEDDATAEGLRRGVRRARADLRPDEKRGAPKRTS